MADSIIYDKNDSVVPGRVKEFKPSQNIVGSIQLTDRNWNDLLPDTVYTWAELKRLREEIQKEMKYWKVVDGRIVEMSQSEKDALDAQIAADREAEEEAQKDIDNIGKDVKVLAILTFNEVNRLRKFAGLEEYTWAQFKKAYKNVWDNLGG